MRYAIAKELAAKGQSGDPRRQRRRYYDDEVLQSVRHGYPVILIEGSGRAADQIAAAWRKRKSFRRSETRGNRGGGNIKLHSILSSVKTIERLITRELGGNECWCSVGALCRLRHECDRATAPFNRIQGAIIAIGLGATILALYKQIWGPKIEGGGDVPQPLIPPDFSRWWFIYYGLLVMPIVLTILVTAVNRFKQGNRWLLLRAGAESIKREIFRYRAHSGDYKEVISPAAVPADPGARVPPPPPTPEQVLAQRVEDVTRRTMRTEVNAAGLVPYDKSKGFPPYMSGEPGTDDGFSALTPDEYLNFRLADQLSYYKRKAVKLERQLKWMQWGIFIIGGVGTLLAAINLQVWIVLTTALVAALTTILGYKGTENTLMKYNQASTDLDNVRSWWLALPAEEQERQENVDSLVDHAEKVLQSN